jgi:hypothetical protein
MEETQVSCINFFHMYSDLQHSQQAPSQQITDRTHPDHSRCQKWSLLLHLHSLHLCKMFIFICWSYFLEKQKTLNWKPVTLNPSLLCKVCKRLSRGMYKPNTSFITFLIIEHSKSLHLVLFCIVMFVLVHIYLWCDILKFMPESFLAFHMVVVHEYPCQCVTLKWHFDTWSNAAGWMCNTLSGAWNYSQQAHIA